MKRKYLIGITSFLFLIGMIEMTQATTIDFEAFEMPGAGSTSYSL